MKTLIIAEAGVNHNGDIQTAKALVDAAAEAGADVVKFQTFKANHLATKYAKQATYQIKSIGKKQNQVSLLKALELKEEHHVDLINYCKSRNVQFLSTAFDSFSVELLASLKLRIWKIPSGEITNLPYMRQIASVADSIILSTGMANLGEIEAALEVLETAGTIRDNITVLHCTTEYPAPLNEVNLRAMETIKQAFGVAVGYSDHTSGTLVPISAVAMGATVIEKHITLDQNMQGPDHKASLEPSEFCAMVKGIRDIEIALGNGIKKPTESEKKNIQIVRKSIVAAKKIKKGDILNETNMIAKRPGTGISPMEWDSFLGKTAKQDFSKDDLIT